VKFNFKCNFLKFCNGVKVTTPLQLSEYDFGRIY